MKPKYWVKLNRGATKTGKDSCDLADIINKTNASFDVNTDRSMWFSFKKLNEAMKFTELVLLKLKYFSPTIGNSK